MRVYTYNQGKFNEYSVIIAKLDDDTAIVTLTRGSPFQNVDDKYLRWPSPSWFFRRIELQQDDPKTISNVRNRCREMTNSAYHNPAEILEGVCEVLGCPKPGFNLSW
jgi:hypothetical protein